MSVLSQGWSWFSVFGTSPWRASMEAPRLEVPAHLLASSRSSEPEGASSYVGVSDLNPKRFSPPSAVLSAAASSSPLPVLPGRAKTPEKVLEVLTFYPWLFGPFVPAHLQAAQKRAGLSKLEDLFLGWFRTLRQKDRDVFDEDVVRSIRQAAKSRTFVEHLEFLKLYDAGEIDRALRNLSTVNPSRVSVLEKASDDLIGRYFGCRVAQDPSRQCRIPPEDPARKLTNTQLYKVRHRLYAAGYRPLPTLDVQQLTAFQCAVYFLGRALHPEAFGFSAPAAGSMSRRLGVRFEPSVRPVLRPTGLPQYPWTYPDGGFGEWTVWSRFHREWTAKEVQDKKLMADLFRAAVTDHPLEIVWIDPDDAAIADILARLLAAKAPDEIFPDRFAFRGPKIRIVVKRSVPEINGWRTDEIREYAVREGPNGREAHP